MKKIVEFPPRIYICRIYNFFLNLVLINWVTNCLVYIIQDFVIAHFENVISVLELEGKKSCITLYS